MGGLFAATLLFAVVWWRRRGRGSKTFEIESLTSEEYGNPYAKMEALHRSVSEIELTPRQCTGLLGRNGHCPDRC